MRTLLVLVLIALSLGGCELLSHRFAGGSEAPPLGEPFEVGFGETVEMEGTDLRLTFVEIDDSRCPEDVTCVWAGRARVALAAELDGARATLRLGIPDPGPAGPPRMVVFEGYRVVLAELAPYPHSERPFQERLYRATLLVEVDEQ